MTSQLSRAESYKVSVDTGITVKAEGAGGWLGVQSPLPLLVSGVDVFNHSES